MIRRETPSSLSVQQKYLLDRIPSIYKLGGFEYPIEPKEVAKARKLVARWDKKVNLLQCRQDKRNQALIRKAREAVYFHKPEDALAIIRQCEKLLKGCAE